MYTHHDFKLTELWEVHSATTHYREKHGYSADKIEEEKKIRGDKFRELIKLRIQGG